MCSAQRGVPDSGGERKRWIVVRIYRRRYENGGSLLVEPTILPGRENLDTTLVCVYHGPNDRDITKAREQLTCDTESQRSVYHRYIFQHTLDQNKLSKAKAFVVDESL